MLSKRQIFVLLLLLLLFFVETHISTLRFRVNNGFISTFDNPITYISECLRSMQRFCKPMGRVAVLLELTDNEGPPCNIAL